nr:hypothetical protein BaRGS_030427 [Batillaria attramentaria]
MSRWAEFNSNPDVMGKVHTIYGGDTFPIEVRYFLAQWIEAQSWQAVDVTNPACEGMARELLDDMIKQLQTKTNSLSGEDFFLIRLKLEQTVNDLQSRYQNNPLGFVKVITKCLQEEDEIFNNATMQPVEDDITEEDTTRTQITEALSQLQGRVNKQERMVQDMQNKQEDFILRYQEQVKLATQIQGLQQMTQSKDVKEREATYQRQKQEVELDLSRRAEHLQTLRVLQLLQRKVLDEQLIGWKRKQQLAGNGFRMEPYALNDIQACTFIVETQPPQVLKKESRFSATVRLLVGGKLNVHMNPPQIKATIISEHQAKSLLRSDMKVKQDTSGEILNNISTMEYQPGNGANISGFLSTQFRNMAVTEEKFCILFQSDFNVGGNDLVFQVWDTLRDRTFSFWEWFYTVYKLTKEHLKGPWSIMGFVGKQQAQEMLNQKPNGTFLLRFSDSECGGITIAWIAESNTIPNEREVWNLAPFIARDFVIRGLADRIKDLGNLTFLYPDIPKNTAFSKYYNNTQEQQQPTNGYIRPHLVNVISM